MTMESAIRSGHEDEVQRLLAQMSETEAVEQLTLTYGRGRNSPDDDGLFEGATPILHAARRGEPAIFSTVVRGMHERMNSQQVKTLLKATDRRGRSVLAMAAHGGNGNVFLQALNFFKEEFPDDQVKEIMKTNDTKGHSLLSLVAGYGSENAFQTVLGALHEVLDGNEVKTMELSRDDDKDSVLALAAMNKSPDMFDVVMAGIENDVTPQELETLLTQRGFNGKSLLATAALQGNKASFEAVLGAVRTRLTPDQVKTMELSYNDSKNSVLVLAAINKSPEVFGAVISAIENDVTPQELETLLTQRGSRGWTLLATAARHGEKASFEAVLKAVRTRLTPKQVKTMELSYNDNKNSVLVLAAINKSPGMFGAVISAIENDVTPLELETLLTQRGSRGWTLLATAAFHGEKASFEAVLEIVRTRLTPEQVKTMQMSCDDDKDSVLVYAASNKSPDMFGAVVSAIENDVTPQELETLLTQRGFEGKSLLATAAMQGNKASFEAILEAVRTRLTRDQVKTMELSCNDHKDSVLVLAAIDKSPDIFGAVMAYIENDVTPQELETLLTQRGSRGWTLLATAAFHGEKASFEAVLEAVRTRLTPEQVKTMQMSCDDDKDSVLVYAASNKSPDMFGAVVSAIENDVTPQELETLLTQRGFEGKSLLATAAMQGNKASFEAILEAVRTRLTRDQVKTMQMSYDDDKDSVLVYAARNKSPDMFGAVVSAIENDVTHQELETLLTQRGFEGKSLLATAAMQGNKASFEAILEAIRTRLTRDQVKTMELSYNDNKNSVLVLAAINKSSDMFGAVMAAIENDVTPQEVKSLILSRDKNGFPLLYNACIQSSVEKIGAIMDAVSAKLTPKEVSDMLRYKDSVYGSLLAVAARLFTTNKEVLEVLFDTVRENLPEEMHELLCRRDQDLLTPIGIVVLQGNLHTCGIVLRSAKENLINKQMSITRKNVEEALDASFLSWAERYEKARREKDEAKVDDCKEILSELFSHSANPPSSFFERIAHYVTGTDERGWDIFTEIIMGGVETAGNPLTPGMAVSVALAEAAKGTREAEQRMFLSFQRRVDTFVLKILERLPQTVRGFENGMSQCSALFEPEGPRNDPYGRSGPLRVAFERREQTKVLCEAALLMDYLYRKFMEDLPDMLDSGRVLQDRDELIRLAKGEFGDGFVLGVKSDPDDPFFSLDCPPYGPDLNDHLSGNALNRPAPGNLKDSKDVGFLRVWVQGANASRPSLTFLPGAQFIIAGILTKPNSYYRVPVLRMALDFVVYIMMLAVYSAWVLLPKDGPLTVGESIFACYVLGAALREMREARRDFILYLQDRWNVLDVLSLVMLAGGFFVRFRDSGSPWGRALYALSAPLVFLRLLFYAQYLPFLGSMVEVIFGMVVVLVRFALILFVVILGFAMALFSLLRDADTPFNFGDILLILFKTLMGDVEAFEEFDDDAGNRYSFTGNLLLVLYLVVMTIMLLNLLIAVLSAAHAKVEMNADKELEVAKVRVVEHYRLVVASDIIPAPFNLVQIILMKLLSFVFVRQPANRGRRCREIGQTVGQVSFWLVLSPVVVILGTLLWAASSIYTPFVPAADLVNRVPSASTLRDSLSEGPPFTRFFTGFLSIYSLLFPARESLQPANRLAKSKAIRLHIGVGVFCALGAPFCLLFLWLREPCLQVFQFIARLTRLRGESRRINSSNEDSVDANEQSTSMLEATGDGPQLSRHDNTDAQVHSILESSGLEASMLKKYLEDPMIDPEVRPDEIKLGATVEHMKLLRNVLEKKFSDRVDCLKKKMDDLGEGHEKKFSGRIDSLEKKMDDRGEGLEEKFSGRIDSLEKKIDDLGEGLKKKLGGGVDSLEKKMDDRGEGLEKFSDRVDFLEKKMDNLGDNLNSFRDDLLKILRGDKRLVDK